MRLEPLSDSNLKAVAGWMAAQENFQWLDFGAGLQILTPVALKVMSQRDLHLMRVFSPDGSNRPIGIVALSNISETSKTATLWYVLGEKGEGGRGFTSKAVSEILGLAFHERGLQAVNAWVVDSNERSRGVLIRNGFRLTGRLRSCHSIDGRLHDRLLFDILASEHEWFTHQRSLFGIGVSGRRHQLDLGLI
jgi:RimJ/RimL family protein N-acetyltransferase